MTTKLFCGECGKITFGESGTGGKACRYYKCANAKKKTGCRKEAVKKEWIENLVVEQTMAVVMNKPLMKQIMDRLLAMQEQESFDLWLLKKQLKEAEKGVENMLNAIQMDIITPFTKQRLVWVLSGSKRKHAKSKRINSHKRQAKSPDSAENQEICGRANTLEPPAQ